MLARLTLYEPDQPARQFLLDNNRRYLIGRDEACTIRIADETLSRRHARLVFRDGGWRLSDLASKNGTLVHGKAISQHVLSDADWIEFGDVLAGFDQVSAAALEAEKERRDEQWQTSVQLSRAFRPRMNLDALLAQVLDSFIAVSGCERGFIMLQQASGDFEPDVSKPAKNSDFSGSRTVVRKTVEGNRPVVCIDTRHDAALGQQPSIVKGSISALACVPLRIGDNLLGVIYVDSARPGKRFTELDIELLQGIADHAALVVAVSRLRERISDLSHLLPPEMSRETPPEPKLLASLNRLLPQLDRTGDGSGKGLRN